MSQPGSNAEPLLAVHALDVSYDEALALHGVRLSVGRSEIVALVGANGAGKSTLLRTIAGLNRARSGTITFDGTNIGMLPAHRIVAAGLSLIPEGRGILGPMTVADNLRIGGYVRRGDRQAALQQVFEWFPVLASRRTQPAGMLSGGEQQMLAIARSLQARPRLLMIDEFSLGLAPKVTSELLPRLAQIRANGTSVLLVDQSIDLVSRIADRMYMLANGRMVWDGRPSELGADDVMGRYLGIGKSKDVQRT